MARKKENKYQGRARKQTILFYPGGLMPPNFLIVDAGESTPKDWGVRWRAILHEAWDEVCDLLGKTPTQQRTGYPMLKALESSLKRWLEIVGDDAAETQAHLKYHEAANTLIYQEGLAYGLKTPLGSAFPGDLAVNSKEGKRGWSKSLVANMSADGQIDWEKEWERLAEKADISFRVPNQYLQGAKLPNLMLESYTFSPNTTFLDAFGTANDHARKYRTSLNGLNRTIRLLQFRLAIVQNVLWQFDMYGNVGPLTMEQVEQIEKDSAPLGRPPEIDRRELARATWILLQRSNKRRQCWHQTKGAPGKPNYTGIFKVLQLDKQLVDVLRKNDGDVIAVDYATRLIRQILTDLRIENYGDFEAMTDEDFETRLQALNY